MADDPTKKIQSVEESVAQRPNIDNTAIFERLWEITVELRQKLETRFQLHPAATLQDLSNYSAPNGSAKGSLTTFSGSEIDWLVHGWIGTPQASFSNMHLTIWLGPQIRVPHLAFALGTIPDFFFYFDYIPRTDLLTDLDYLDSYYEPANPTYLALQADSRLKPFISKTPYIRQTLTCASLCYTASFSEEILTLVKTVAHEMMDRWLGWVDAATPVPEDERAALSERDLRVRRAIAERDPANQLAARLFGADFTNTLIRGLWGGDRLPTRT